MKIEKKQLGFRIFGYLSSLVLTLGAYAMIVYPSFFHLSTEMAIVVILIFALMQAAGQFLFFLNIWKEGGPPWNLGVFFSTLSIILIIIAFSLWIMHTLDYNMMF